MPSAESLVLLTAEQQDALAAVRRLPTRQREVLILRYWMDMSESEIGEVLDITRGTVKSTASRALAAVALHMEASDHD